ncbi:MAG: TonB family protein [Gammaproteobacteria bacterium]|nr:TonB family protein [Gammaproteobacteria bacterium]
MLRPYYRNFELPWETSVEENRRFYRMLWAALALLAVVGIIVPFIPLSKPKAIETVPPRLARVMIEQKPQPPPPPPPPPKVEPRPQAKPVPQPLPVDARQRAREKAEQRLARIRDELADLRQMMQAEAPPTRDLKGAVGEEARAERSLISARAGRGSTGIDTSGVSRGFGAGAGSLTGIEGTRVTSGIAAGSARGATRTAHSGKAGRSREEIELVFDRNKGAIYALYSRAQRERPELQGKVVLEFTISPAGEVTMCRIVSSDLADPELERKIVARVRLFRFEARDVETITTTKPIDFFPA